ncbi:VOC family protein [Vibrio bathopelagicus]|uniref:VOC family protein n=1 Tax=Vibrio bathopelagicus TaxID=2777577 RepID=UPI00186531BB|nr:VOC family protein [Vibrio bathopelagicus]
MIVRGFEHFTIRTNKLKETRDFYIKLLGLRVGPRPDFNFDGYWLYLNNDPIFHLVEAAMNENDPVAKYLGMKDVDKEGSGRIDHLAFRIEGYASLLEKIEIFDWNYFERTVPNIFEHQVFFTDPNKITIELIFHDSEYKEWQKPNKGI